MSWWDTALSIGGKVFDFLDDNEWVTDTLTRLAIDHPELDYNKLMELAVQEAIIQSPDIQTPQGSVTWDVDPETGKRTGRQEYSPQIQALYQSLVQNAGAPISTYQNPEKMGQTMLGNLMGQPDYQRPVFNKPGVDIPPFSYAPVGQGPGNTANPGGTPGGREPTPSTPADVHDIFGMGTEDPRFAFLQPGTETPGSDMYGYGGNNMSLNPDLSPMNDLLDEFTGTLRGSDPDATNQWLIENADHMGTFIGFLAGIPGLGHVADWLVDKFHWDDNQWQSPITPIADDDYAVLKNLIDEEIPPQIPPSGDRLYDAAVGVNAGSEGAFYPSGGSYSPYVGAGTYGHTGLGTGYTSPQTFYNPALNFGGSGTGSGSLFGGWLGESGGDRYSKKRE